MLMPKLHGIRASYLAHVTSFSYIKTLALIVTKNKYIDKKKNERDISGALSLCRLSMGQDPGIGLGL